MRCVKCNSSRIIRFLDGFGDRRIFCRSCQESFLIEGINSGKVKKLSEFFHSIFKGVDVEST